MQRKDLALRVLSTAPPPYTFFNSNNLQSFAILFVYFSPGRKCKNTLPLPVKAKKGCFYAQ